MAEREPLTTSEMSTFLSCMRRYYLRYMMRFSTLDKSGALRFGSAWHMAMECRWRGADYAAALNAALTCRDNDIDAVMAAQIAGMLAGYYARWGAQDSQVKELYAEVAFEYPLKGSLTFNAAGKIDGLGIDHDGRYVLLEHKSSGEDISDGSDFWMRLKLNPQLFQYITAARHNGWDITRIIYDVAKKPALKPLADVPTLDADGLKQVVGADGVRVFKKDGTPKQTADKDKGECVVSAPETMDHYAERVAADCIANPDKYFQRREVPILDADVEEFEGQRISITKVMMFLRAASRKLARAEQAWPRNCNGMTCKFCDFKHPCLSGIELTPENCASFGFTQRAAKHEELQVTE